MDLLVEREDVWVTSVEQKAGSLAAKLSALADAGADLDFIIARRAPEKPGWSALFVTPIRGDREVQAATDAGFSVTNSLHSIRVEGPDEPGAAMKVAKAIGDAGIPMRGFSGAVLGTRFVVHAAVDTCEQKRAVVQLLSGL